MIRMEDDSIWKTDAQGTWVVFVLQRKNRSLRDGSVVKNTSHSCRGSKFKSLH